MQVYHQGLTEVGKNDSKGDKMPPFPPKSLCVYVYVYMDTYVNTVGPWLSEHLCATSMLKVFR